MEIFFYIPQLPTEEECANPFSGIYISGKKKIKIFNFSKATQRYQNSINKKNNSTIKLEYCSLGENNNLQ